jgi:hypothetical protein
MNNVGKTVFGGSRFVFWALTPFVVLFLITITTLALMPGSRFGLPALVMLVISWLVGLSLIVGMWNPARFGWGLRIVAAVVFLLYLAYVISELNDHYWHWWKWDATDASDRTSPFMAICGLAAIGFPALLYAVLGRFTLRPEVWEDEEQSDFGDD